MSLADDDIFDAPEPTGADAPDWRPQLTPVARPASLETAVKDTALFWNSAAAFFADGMAVARFAGPEAEALAVEARSIAQRISHLIERAQADAATVLGDERARAIFDPSDFSAAIDDGHETRTDFAARCGVSNRCITVAAKDSGLPNRASDGAIPIEAGLAWVRENRPQWLGIDDGHETRTDFAARCGVSNSCITVAARDSGLPKRASDGAIPIEAGLAWVRENRPKWLGNDDSHESQVSFAARCGVTRASVAVAAMNSGLPKRASDGAIPIEAGLAWVRENRPQWLNKSK